MQLYVSAHVSAEVFTGQKWELESLVLELQMVANF